MPNILINPNSGIIEFSTGIAGGSAFDAGITGGNRVARLNYDNLGGLNLTSYVNITGTAGTSGQDRFSIDGVNGRLFSVTDSLSGSLLSVNDIAGLPIFEVFDDNRIVAGQFNRNDFIISGNSVGIGGTPNTGSHKLYVSGNVDVSGILMMNGSGVALSGNLATTGSNLSQRVDTLSGNLNALSGSTNTFLRVDSAQQSVDGTKFFLGNVTINNLTVTGTQSIVSSNDFTVKSNFITINSGELGNNGISLISDGLRIDRGTGAAFPDALLIFNEQNRRFEFGVVGDLSGIAPIEMLNTTNSNLVTTNSNLATTNTNLAQTGSTLSLNISSLSGTLTGNYVTLNTTQNIGGAKNFTTRPQFNNNNLVILSDLANQSNLVFTTGDQTVSGVKAFASRPTVNGTGVLLQNEATRLDNVVFQTGNQFVSGQKNFQFTPQVNGLPVLVSGIGNLFIQTQNETIPNGSVQRDINFISAYNAGVTPVVIGNLYSTGVNEDVIPFQLQNITNTGFRVSIANPVTGYQFSFMSFQSTGINFLAQGAPGNIFNQKIQLNTGVISQVVNFGTTFPTLPTVSLQLEDRNNPPHDSFFLYRITGLSTSSFNINLSNPIPAPFSGFFMHVIASY